LKINIPNSVVVALTVLITAALGLAFVFGLAVQRYKLYPYPLVAEIELAIESMLDQRPGAYPWYYRPSEATSRITDNRPNPSDNPLNLVTSILDNDELSIQIMDMAGNTVHAWTIDWFDIWPNPQHVAAADIPKAKPGTLIHGAQLFDNGDVVFNFENLGMVRMGLCGEVIWKLPYRTHHSIEIDDEGNLWAPAQRFHTERLADFPKHTTPVSESMVIKVSPDGELLQEISVLELLDRNELRALLHMPADKKSNSVSGDALHVNDAEPLPASLAQDASQAGNIMISIRNISTILIFNPDSYEISFMHIGGFVRQHDPDYLPGGRISVFDNNTIGPEDFGQQSRIVILSEKDESVEVFYTGSSEAPFYTSIMGKSQWLTNGNLLITESVNGRAFEINPDGEIIWEFTNIVAEGRVGIVAEVQRLPASYTPLFQQASCQLN
jgi:hypothetical protein